MELRAALTTTLEPPIGQARRLRNNHFDIRTHFSIQNILATADAFL